MPSYIIVVALEHIDGNFTGDGLLAGSKEPSDVEEHEDSMAVVLTMLFHNRPVKAAMGSVIVNGGVQLSGG